MQADLHAFDTSRVGLTFIQLKTSVFT